jgi:hypothetical protein
MKRSLRLFLQFLTILLLVFLTTFIIKSPVVLFAWIIWGGLVLYDQENDGKVVGDKDKFILTISGAIAILMFYGFFSLVAWAIFP